MLDISAAYAQGERGREIEAQLDAYAALDPPNVCWLFGCDDGEDYCSECAQGEIDYFGRGVSVDGGCSSVETDGCCHCASCGQLLNYILTDYGVTSELQHFYRRRLKSPLDKTVAFHVARILLAAPADDGALRLGERALRAIRQPLT